MIYVDSSVVLAEVFAELRRPEPDFWMRGRLISSRLAEYECWVRTHSYGRAGSHGPVLAERLGRLDLLALDEVTCARVRAPFPVPMRTLDALHLATADYLRMQGFEPSIATYDERLRTAATALGFAVAEP